jgi:hypothetical protein
MGSQEIVSLFFMTAKSGWMTPPMFTKSGRIAFGHSANSMLNTKNRARSGHGFRF